MTLHELSRVYYIKMLMRETEESLDDIKARIEPGIMNMSGMPHNPNVAKAIEIITPEIAKLKKQLLRETRIYGKELAELRKYIVFNTQDDYRMRTIMLYRFVHLCSWEEVAIKVGGNNTEDSVKKACYRFIKKSQKSKSCPECPAGM